jgi:hypothetical protein
MIDFSYDICHRYCYHLPLSLQEKKCFGDKAKKLHRLDVNAYFLYRTLGSNHEQKFILDII